MSHDRRIDASTLPDATPLVRTLEALLDKARPARDAAATVPSVAGLEPPAPMTTAGLVKAVQRGRSLVEQSSRDVVDVLPTRDVLRSRISRDRGQQPSRVRADDLLPRRAGAHCPRADALHPIGHLGGGGFPAVVTFDVVVVNGTEANFDPAHFNTMLQSANQEGSPVFDSKQGLEWFPTATLLPGREAKFRIGYLVQDPADFVLTPDPPSILVAPAGGDHRW